MVTLESSAAIGVQSSRPIRLAAPKRFRNSSISHCCSAMSGLWPVEFRCWTARSSHRGSSVVIAERKTATVQPQRPTELHAQYHGRRLGVFVDEPRHIDVAARLIAQVEVRRVGRNRSIRWRCTRSPASTSCSTPSMPGRGDVYSGPLKLGQMDERMLRIDDRKRRTVRRVMCEPRVGETA
jgi:hypothetical protein